MIHSTKYYTVATLFMSVFAWALVGCSTVPSANKIASADGKNVQRFNVELVNEIPDQCSEGTKIRTIPTAEKPEYMPAPDPSLPSRYRIVSLIPCSDSKKQVYIVRADLVKRITEVSDPLSPPTVELPPTDPELTPPDVCCPERNKVLYELRGLVGFRGRDENPYLHQTPTGTVEYDSKFINFDRGGSNLVLGLEGAVLFPLDNEGRWHLGPMLGVMPIDESVFLNLSIHPRYNFNPMPNTKTFDPECTNMYLYGDLGIPFDFQTGAPIIGSLFSRQRYFIGAGIGWDIPVGCDYDFSVDVGIRHANHPLPELECCPDAPADVRNAYRAFTMFLVRFGFTF